MTTADEARRFDELDPKVKDMLRRMAPEQVETLTYLSTIPRDEVRGMMKMFRDMKAVGWFVRWLVITIVAIFITTVAVGENIGKVIRWMKGG